MVVGDEGHTLNGHERRVLGLFFRFCPCIRSYVANYSPFSQAAFRASSNGWHHYFPSSSHTLSISKVPRLELNVEPQTVFLEVKLDACRSP